MTSVKPLPEEELDRVIDALNAGRTPPDPSTADAADHAVLVRALKAMGDLPTQAARRRRRGRWVQWAAAAAVAAGVVLAVQVLLPGPGDRNCVQATEQAAAPRRPARGGLGVRTANAGGGTGLARGVEAWSDGGRYAARAQDGVLTAHAGSR